MAKTKPKPEKPRPKPEEPFTRVVDGQRFDIVWNGRNKTALPSALTANSSRRLAREIRFQKETSSHG
jgi:hypothetical protein